ncbi:MAG TPA: TraR/DksA family transcriptional regulator [Thermodesulfobacteriota bacterium]|nr:TraR/DksA family transcriptional regulator [Deltaproteobacteria bacterium]HNR13643.1 TraR/DksA family transcriptional regulator [Thermodesulfobacteriota bacterium]HNU72033.1 TraR/DksA family transcriptional regulator [Thermodesulfobacteriota bacterium]HOC37811.1 TraR/DksA family transcriptional regulator [Thermodesulfobacteriota bacterium]
MKKEEVRDRLLQLREETLSKIAGNMKTEIGHLQEAISDLYDLADDERERQFSILLCDRDRDTLAQIDEALERLEEGEYGLCEECGEKISPARLKIRPFARYCVTCMSRLEKNEKYLRTQDDSLRYRSMIRDADEAEE